MAGDWIKVEKRTPRKYEILTIAEVCGVSVGDAFLAWFQLWSWLDEETDSGHLPKLSPQKCDYLGGLPKLGQALAECGWVEFTPDGGAIIHNWDRHNGKSAKKRTLVNRRKVEFREREAERKRNAASVPLA